MCNTKVSTKELHPLAMFSIFGLFIAAVTFMAIESLPFLRDHGKISLPKQINKPNPYSEMQQWWKNYGDGTEKLPVGDIDFEDVFLHIKRSEAPTNGYYKGYTFSLFTVFRELKFTLNVLK